MLTEESNWVSRKVFLCNVKMDQSTKTLKPLKKNFQRSPDFKALSALLSRTGSAVAIGIQKSQDDFFMFPFQQDRS